MQQLKMLGTLTLIGLLTSACNGTGFGVTKEGVGTVVGGAAGGAACANVGKGRGNTAAVVGCTLVGALLGGSVGRSMDETDQLKARQAIMQTPTNQTVSWYNPDSGSQYQVTPVSNPQNMGNGNVCRDYATTAVIEGRRETVHGTACRQADGTWQTR